MEKLRPSYDLETFKAVCGDPQRLQMTVSAALSARSLGLAAEDIAALIRTMRRSMFRKSMTSYRDHTLWQDVYHVPAGEDLVIYLKFTADVVSEFVVLSFKEK